MQRFIHFLQYHNAIPVALGILFLGATGTYAATNPETIYQAAQAVVAIDNTYIAGKNLDAWTPRAEITGVTEDAENYYVAFRFSTIDLEDAVWRDVVRDEVMTVSKADLGPYRDLGLFVAEQLRQKIGRELQRLRETQVFEKRNVTQKMVATVYSGLVGRFLDDTTDVLPGYTPVVVPPAQPAAVFTEAMPIPAAAQIVPQPPQPVTIIEQPNEPASSAPSEPSDPSTNLTIQILGDNPTRIAVGSAYHDLGAVASNDANEEIAVALFVNGAPVGSVSIDTAAPGTWSIRYVAEDASGSIEAMRTVEVYAPEPAAPSQPEPAPEPPPAQDASVNKEVTPTPDESAPQPEPAPPAAETPKEPTP